VSQKSRIPIVLEGYSGKDGVEKERSGVERGGMSISEFKEVGIVGGRDGDVSMCAECKERNMHT
jgi:hypothetical protein